MSTDPHNSEGSKIMKKNKKTATSCGSTQPKGLLEFVDALNKGVSENPEKGVERSVIVSDLRDEFQPNWFAEGLLRDTYPDWMPQRLRSQMEDALRGLDGAMAIEVADNLLDCWSFGVRHYVGIVYIDRMLHSLYNKIFFAAERQGIELPMHY